MSDENNGELFSYCYEESTHSQAQENCDTLSDEERTNSPTSPPAQQTVVAIETDNINLSNSAQQAE